MDPPASADTHISDHPVSSIYASDNSRVHVGDSYIYHIHKDGTDSEHDPGAVIVKSLQFPEMFSRYASIEERRGGTCEWIMTDHTTDDSNSLKNSSFRKWLGDDTPIYWVSGKPGSGKSTLMKYLCTAIQDDLEDASKIIVLSFWFWEAGSSLEKNLEGLLRSLLCQLLQNPVGQSMALRYLRRPISTPVWAVSKLQNALRSTLLALAELQVLVCLFLDGLDECGQDAEAILETIDNLIASTPATKICVSSRPEQLFLDTFSSYPSLRLQDLNKEDIDKVIENDLFAKPIIKKLLRDKVEIESTLKWSLQGKAQGVFLWVRLAIRSLLRGITHRDTLDVLLRRLESLPDDIDKLYTKMLSRTEDDFDYYKSTTALYFKLALHRSFNMISFYLAAEPNYRKLFLGPSQWSVENVMNKTQLDDMNVWINVKTAGLLEVQPKERNIERVRYTGPLSFLNRYLALRINFIHRTALSYVTDTSVGSQLLSACPITSQELSDTCFEVTLIETYIFQSLDSGKVYLLTPRIHYENCKSCIEPSISVVEEAKKVWTACLEKDRLAARFHFLPGTEPIRSKINGFGQHIEIPFPLLHDGSIDFVSAFCCLAWYTHADDQLGTSDLCKNKDFVTKVFMLLLTTRPWIISDDKTQTRHSFFNLMKRLRSLGAKRTECMQTCYGEQIDSFCILQSAISPYPPTAIESARALINDFAEPVSQEIESTIYGIAGCVIRSYFQYALLGNFSLFDIQDLCQSEFRFQTSSQVVSKVRVIVVRAEQLSIEVSEAEHRVSRSHFYSISSNDSEEMVSRLKQAQKKRGSRRSILLSHKDGVIYASTPRWYTDSTGRILEDEAIHRSIIHEVISKSKYLGSAIDALSYLGKSQDLFDQFIATQEVEFRLLGLSEEEIAYYKSLFIAEPFILDDTSQPGQDCANMTEFAINRVLNF